MLFFHGWGERGDDNESQLRHAAPDILKYIEAHEPCILLAPQCPAEDEQRWVNTQWNLLKHTMEPEPLATMRDAIALLQSVMAEQPVDPQRVYVTGLSMGGFATWDILQRHPELFAAAIPVCGGGDTAQAPKLKDLPLWVFHGEEDKTVLPERSRDMVEAIRSAGGSPRYTEYAGVGHNSWDVTYKNPEVLDWLFKQKKQ